ncbi:MULTISPECIES: hypothetical protein [Actinosynnema]|uniref:hypothetical protein n=1 Tax=Actinosynnema TaxID=40566 RepID=UPI0020A4F1BA|nr:hypothetical protein [Actinosynnema pretiosum]
MAVFSVGMAAFSPVLATITGVLRGVVPFVAAHRDEPDVLVPVIRTTRWPAVLVGGFGAVAIAAVPPLAAAAGVPEATVDALGVLPHLLALAALTSAVGAGAGSALVGLGRGEGGPALRPAGDRRRRGALARAGGRRRARPGARAAGRGRARRRDRAGRPRLHGGGRGRSGDRSPRGGRGAGPGPARAS